MMKIILEKSQNFQSLETHFNDFVSTFTRFHQFSEEEFLTGLAYGARTKTIVKHLEGEAAFQSHVFYITDPLGDSFKCDIEVKDSSPERGRGLFAKALIKEGSIITFFPPHCLLDKENAEEIFSGEKFPLNKRYEVVLNKKYSIFGNPQKIDKPLLLGHLINDSTLIKISDDDNDIEFKNRIIRYVLNSSNNAEIRGNEDETWVYVVAKRDIQAGEEIFMSYGFGYWLTRRQYRKFEKILKSDPEFVKFLTSHVQHLV